MMLSEEKRNEIKNQLGEKLEKTRKKEKETHNPFLANGDRRQFERGDERLYIDTLINERKMILSEIEKLEKAIRRIIDGEYGVCSSCGKEINPERLLANQVAEECIDCCCNHKRYH